VVVRGAILKSAVTAAVAAALLSPAPCRTQPPAATWRGAVGGAEKAHPGARIVVLDVAAGRLLASTNPAEAARTLAAPGSTLKPLVLHALVSSGRWNPARRIACDRRLHIAGRSLACSHPPAGPMDAEQALAWSCNTYFAAVGASLQPGELRRILAPTGLLSQTGFGAGEAVAEFRDPSTPSDASLAVLGVEGIRVTPFELGAAYRWLALQLAAHPDSAASQTVQAGLNDSASFGIGAAASLGGVPVAGKTGTANAGPGTGSHGWFAGLAPAAKPAIVVVIYLPSGRGADAARVAADLLARSPLMQAAP
jgi:penicillin-binding protein 2